MLTVSLAQLVQPWLSLPAGEPVCVASGSGHQLLLPLTKILCHVYKRRQPGLEHLPVLPETRCKSVRLTSTVYNCLTSDLAALVMPFDHTMHKVLNVI